MIKPYREAYNRHFTKEKYQAFMHEIKSEFDCVPEFRVAETPVFIPKILKERLITACDDIMSVINQPNFKELTKEALKNENLEVPREDYSSRFIQMDFGICIDENGDPIPKLIELQGFPSLYFYQDFIARMYKKHFDLPERLNVHLNGLKRDEYIELLREEIIGDTEPSQVILLEIEPDKQATRVDFVCAERALGLKVLCISQLKKRGKELFYINDKGQSVKVKKIYNRVIFDELNQRDDIKREFYFHDEVDVEWVGHPNWFFRISKYTMPLLKGDFVPECFYLGRLDKYPDDLSRYVLKPLYSFAGSGVQLNVTKELLDSIKHKDHYLLQEKVAYHPIVETMDVPAKCEIRMMGLYNTREKKTNLVNNIVRLSKGEMIGTKFNKDKEWVGGSLGFFEE